MVVCFKSGSLTCWDFFENSFYFSITNESTTVSQKYCKYWSGSNDSELYMGFGC